MGLLASGKGVINKEMFKENLAIIPEESGGKSPDIREVRKYLIE